MAAHHEYWETAGEKYTHDGGCIQEGISLEVVDPSSRRGLGALDRESNSGTAEGPVRLLDSVHSRHLCDPQSWDRASKKCGSNAHAGKALSAIMPGS